MVPIRNELEHLKRILLSVGEQTILPKEIVIVDSSKNEEIKEFVEEHNNIIPIIYHYEKKAYPGKARNIGVEIARGDWIAFLDSKTIPNENWLERYQHLVQAYNAVTVFGVTKFKAESPFQKTLRAATYGKIGHHTVPGTMIEKKIYIDSGGFLEHVRMGEDIEWRERLVKNGFNIHWAEKPVVTYVGLPDNFSSTMKKYLTSAYHTARLNILRNVKDAYLALALVLSAIIIPKWNHLIGEWDTNPLYIPNVTKIYLLSIIALLLAVQLFRWLFSQALVETLFSRSLKIVVFMFVTLTVYRWNAVIAGWMEDAALYIPHITKIYVFLILSTSILFRGAFQPLRRQVEVGYLFPFRWIGIGLLGLCLDLVKAPGYLVGGITSLFPFPNKKSKHEFHF